MSSSKPKNGKTSSQDYMNLLYSDSESDTVPDLKLPPLKGKKPRRRGTRRPSDDSLCSLWMILRVVIVSVLVISIVTLGIITYWSFQQIRELKDQVNAMENKNAGTPEEFQALQSKLVSVNKMVTGIKTGKYGLDDLNKTIVSMQQQITSLTATATELKKTVGSLEPNKETQAVRNTVADLGSTVQSNKNLLESLKTSQKSFTSELEVLANRVSSLENPDRREGGSSATDTSDIQALLTQINATFTKSIGLALESIGRQQTHLDAVDKFTQGVEDQVKNISQEMSNLTQSQQRLYDMVSSQEMGGRQETEKEGEGEESLTDMKASLTQLQDQVQHLQLLLEQVQADHKNVTKMGEATDSNKATAMNEDIQSLMKDHEDFVIFRDEVFSDITRLNATLSSVNGSVDVLNKDVGELFVKLGMAMSDISNISNVVERLTKLLPGLLAKSATTHTPIDGDHQGVVDGKDEHPSNHSTEGLPSGGDADSDQPHENEPISEGSTTQPAEGDSTTTKSTTLASEVEKNKEPSSEAGSDSENSDIPSSKY